MDKEKDELRGEETDEEDDRKPPAVVRELSHRTDGEDEEDEDDDNYSDGVSSVFTPAPVYSDPHPASLTSLTVDKDVVVMKTKKASRSSSSGVPVHVVALTGTSVLSLVSFAYFLLPAAAVASLAMFGASFGLAAHQGYYTMWREYEARLRREGLRAFLPADMVQLLTERSLSDVLLEISERPVDPEAHQFAMSWLRLLALYFMPGLTREQRLGYVRRMQTQHVQVLERPGLGNFLGPQFMDFLNGDGSPTIETIQDGDTHAPTDSASDTREEGSGDQLEDQEREAMARALPAARLRSGRARVTPPEIIVEVDENTGRDDDEDDDDRLEEERREAAEEEHRIFMEAVTSTVAAQFESMSSTVTTFVSETFRNNRRTIWIVGGGGVAVWTIVSLVAPSSSSSRYRSPGSSLRSSSLWTTAVLGGGVASFVWTGWFSSSSKSPPTSKNSPSSENPQSPKK